MFMTTYFVNKKTKKLRHRTFETLSDMCIFLYHLSKRYEVVYNDIYGSNQKEIDVAFEKWLQEN